MKIVRVMALLWASSAFAVTSPSNDVYSDSLTIQRASAEAPGSLDASTGDSSGAGLNAEVSANDTDEQPMESVAEVVQAAKTKPKKSARK